MCDSTIAAMVEGLRNYCIVLWKTASRTGHKGKKGLCLEASWGGTTETNERDSLWRQRVQMRGKVMLLGLNGTHFGRNLGAKVWGVPMSANRSGVPHSTD